MKKPSARNSAAVFSGMRQYPWNTFGPFTSIIPTASGPEGRAGLRIDHPQGHARQGEAHRAGDPVPA